jgi:ADP-ribosyl-[dinitrogen reductase] hydrolase
MLGLAVGDALGAPLEFKSREEASAAVEAGLEMNGGGNWDPGEWTDDTAMALCIAECIGERGFPLDLDDLVRRYAAWAASGPKDIGITTRSALAGVSSAAEARKNAETHHERTARTAGNGTVMRIAPIAFAPGTKEEILDGARDDARLTHWDEAASCASAALCAALLALSGGAEPWEAAARQASSHSRLAAAVELAAQDDRAAVGELAGGGEGGTCWATLATGLCALHFDGYEEGVAWAISHGFDTDTNAAVAGALIGCRDGVEAIPKRWISGLRERERIESVAERLGRGEHA